MKNVPEHIAVPVGRFQHVHLDIIGPLPISQGYKYCLTMLDRYSRWPEAIPIIDTSAETVVPVFYSNWIARYGTRATITTDRGSQFEGQLFQAFMQIMGCQRNRTTAYHPASNGSVER